MDPEPELPEKGKVKWLSLQKADAVKGKAGSSQQEEQQSRVSQYHHLTSYSGSGGVAHNLLLTILLQSCAVLLKGKRDQENKPLRDCEELWWFFRASVSGGSRVLVRLKTKKEESL